MWFIHSVTDSIICLAITVIIQRGHYLFQAGLTAVHMCPTSVILSEPSLLDLSGTCCEGFSVVIISGL